MFNFVEMKFKNIIKIRALRIFISLSSCKINQTRNALKQGKWIEAKQFINTHSSSEGRYKKGEKVGKWNYSINDRIVSQEKYKKNSCHIIKYHNTGKVQQIGHSKKTTVGTKTEWLPSGKWIFYDSEGVLLGTKIYENGIPIQEIYEK